MSDRSKTRRFTMPAPSLSPAPMPRDVEQKASLLAERILEAEGFEGIRRGPGFPGTPFDFFAFREGSPYIIEMKGSKAHFRIPDATQKRRLHAVLRCVPGVRGAILQIRLDSAEYRLIEGADLSRVLEEHRSAALKPIERWIREAARTEVPGTDGTAHSRRGRSDRARIRADEP